MNATGAATSGSACPATALVAAFVARTRYPEIPSEAVRSAKKALLDTLGVGLAGARSAGSAIIAEYIRHLGSSSGAATVFGTGIRTQARFAALANGAAIHADDYDDTFHPSRVHSSGPAVAAVLAAGEERHTHGRDALAAFCVGSEVTCRISTAIDRAHYQRGYHATSTCGVFGAAAGACNVRGLSTATTQVALGIAGSDAAGLRENFGTMVKPWHAGRAAENGIVAASLAERGFTAAASVLEGPRGFFMAGGGGFDAAMVARIGESWSYVNPGVSVKPYPSGNLAHPAMSKLEELVRLNDIRPENVERVSVRSNRLLPLNLTYHRPTTGLEGKFSMEFCLASILCLRRAGLTEFSDAVVNRPDVQQAIRKIDYVTYSDADAEAGGYAFLTTFLDIAMTDGRRFSARADTSRGSSVMPMSEDEVADKFRACAEFAGCPRDRAEEIIEMTLTLETLPDVSVLAHRLGAGE